MSKAVIYELRLSLKGNEMWSSLLFLPLVGLALVHLYLKPYPVQTPMQKGIDASAQIAALAQVDITEITTWE